MQGLTSYFYLILQLNDVIDCGFTCTDDEFASLETKFDLYRDLEATAEALKEFNGPSCPSVYT